MKKPEAKFMQKPVVVFLTATLCCAMWGSAFPMIKIGYSLLDISSSDYSSQILFAGVRFTLAGIFTLLAGSALSGKVLLLKKKNTGKVLVLALFQTVLQYLFFYIGLSHITGTKGSIINSVSVFFSVLLASLVLKQERLTINKLAGCLIGFAGVVLINIKGADLTSSVSFIGEGFMVLSALSYAVSSVLINRFSKEESPVALSGSQFVIGGIVMIAVGSIMGGRLNITGVSIVLVIVYLAVLSAAAYTLWGILLKYNEVSRVTVFGFMTPVFGCLLSVLILGENLKGSVLITVSSLILVSVGILIVNIKTKSEKLERKYES